LVFAGREEPHESLVFWVDPVSQWYALQMRVGDTSSDLIPWSLSAAIHTGNQANHLAIRQDGELLHLYVNGEHLLSLADETAGENTLVGISHWARHGGWSTSRFDDFTTTTPTIAFEDDFSDAHSGWVTGEEDGCRLAYQEGEYVMACVRDSASVSGAPSYPLPDGRFELQVRRGESFYATAYGLAFGGNYFFNRFYALWLVPDSQHFALFKFDAGWYTLVPWSRAPAAAAGPATNLLSIVRDGARIQVYVNNEHQTTVEDSSLLENGYFGLLNWALPYGPGTAFFDDLQVTIWDVVPAPFQAPTRREKAGVIRLPPPSELPPQSQR
jgi:hypothetical protein